jgi:hypothetical protein
VGFVHRVAVGSVPVIGLSIRAQAQKSENA